MEEEKNKTKDQPGTPLIKDNKGIPDWLTPLLSAVGSMGGGYLLWIKPMQDKLDALSNQLTDLKGEIKELKQEVKEYKQKGENVKPSLETDLNGESYLPIKRSGNPGSYYTKRI
jgi:hypothetical protein